MGEWINDRKARKSRVHRSTFHVAGETGPDENASKEIFIHPNASSISIKNWYYIPEAAPENVPIPTVNEKSRRKTFPFRDSDERKQNIKKLYVNLIYGLGYRIF